MELRGRGGGSHRLADERDLVRGLALDVFEEAVGHREDHGVKDGVGEGDADFAGQAPGSPHDGLEELGEDEGDVEVNRLEGCLANDELEDC